MKTRFGGGYIGYLIAIAWPLSHLATIVVGYMIVNHYAPVGDDPFVFVVTAALPYMLCLYPSRLVAMGILVNRPFLSYNIVTTHHLILARIVLEFLNVVVVVILIFVVCYVVDTDIMPLSVAEAAAALGMSVFLGVALGFFFAVLTAILGQFMIVFIIVLMLLLYVGSLAFMPDYLLSSNSREYLIYNPMYCLIKWLRSAYYASYESDDFLKMYVMALSFGFLFLGVLGERFLRGRIIGA